MKGRKPKPTTLHILHGTLNSTRHEGRANEPRPEVNIPEPPEEMDATALAEWQRITVELHGLGLLSRLDRAALAAYCVFYSRWIQAEAQVKRLGPIIVTKDREFKTNPWLPVANRAAREMASYLSEFGLTPASRTRIQSIEPPKKDNAKSRFFAG